MIKIHDLSFAYGEKQIFGGLSLEIPDGARSCIFGGSGCGKQPFAADSGILKSLRTAALKRAACAFRRFSGGQAAAL
ncbi:MAG: hypothetical protein ACLR56_01165 [Oscillospiraceae bacterium]